LKRGSPASERGDCSSKNEGARGIRSAGVTTAAVCWAVTCERQWPLWHGNCCSGVSGGEPWSRFSTTAVALALEKPRSHPAQWISETSRPSVSKTRNGSRQSRLPILASARVTPTCIIVTVSKRPPASAFKALFIKQRGQGRGHKAIRIGLHLHGGMLDAEIFPQTVGYVYQISIARLACRNHHVTCQRDLLNGQKCRSCTLGDANTLLEVAPNGGGIDAGTPRSSTSPCYRAAGTRCRI
jgi:hypothetical protein